MCAQFPGEILLQQLEDMVCDLLLPRDGLSSSTQLHCYKWQLNWRELEQAMNWAKAGSSTADIFTAGDEVPKMKNDLEPPSVASFERQAGLCKEGLVQWRCWGLTRLEPLGLGIRGGTAAEQTLCLGKCADEYAKKPVVSSGSCGDGCW